MHKFLFSTIWFLLLFTACGQEDCGCTKEDLNLRLSIVPESLSPQTVSSLGETTLTNLLMEGLVRFSPSGEVTLASAQEYTISNQGKTYTFILKETTWSDGSQVTAYDFVNAWRKSLSSSCQSPHQSQLFAIKNAKEVKRGILPSTLLGVKALSNSVLCVELSSPNPYFLKNLAHPIFFPQHKSSCNLTKQEFADKQIVSNGRFLLNAWEERSLELKRNQAHWEKKPTSLERVLISCPIENCSSVVDNSAASTEGLSPSVFLQELAKLEISTIDATNIQSGFIRINQKHPLLKNKQSRVDLCSLFQHHIQHSETISKYGTKASKLTPCHALNYNSEPLVNSDNESISNHVLIYYQDSLSELASSFANLHWITSEKVEKEEYDRLINNHEYELALESTSEADTDPICFLELFNRWEDSEYHALLNKARESESQVKREELYISAEKRLSSEAIVIPVFHSELAPDTQRETAQHSNTVATNQET